MAKILIVSDAWIPQTNGVVTTLQGICKEAHSQGDIVTVVHPGTFGITLSRPYPNVSLFYIPSAKLKKYITQDFDYIHIATPETCLGYLFLQVCKQYQIKYTCAYHTKFPEFLKMNYNFPLPLGWSWVRHVLKNSHNIITTTPSMVKELENQISNKLICPWVRGVDHTVFTPGDRNNPIRKICGYPIVITVARISPEKGLEDFCKSKLGERATKIIIGDGPDKTMLQKKYPDVTFVGYQSGQELIQWYQAADCFVFTSKKDTLGAVMLEAMACGTPIAAYPVTGPKDIIINGINGYVADSLTTAIEKCLDIDRQTVYNTSIQFSWSECYKQFKNLLI